jgi:hypothetical protein
VVAPAAAQEASRAPNSQAVARAEPIAPVPGAAPGKSAKPPSSTNTWGEHRVMGGHSFPLATLVPSAFALTYIGVLGGIEYHVVPGFSKPIGLFSSGGSERINLQTLNVIEAVDFGVRLHDRVALFGTAYGRARVGVNTPTLLGNGGDYRYGADLGALGKLLRVDDFQLSLRAQGGYYAGQQAGILGLFRDLSAIVSDAFARVQQNPTADIQGTLDLVNTAFRSATKDLLTPFHGFRYGAALVMAQGLGKFVGGQIALGAEGDSTSYFPSLYDVTLSAIVTNEQRTTSIAGRGAIAIDADAAPAGFPFDFMLEYAISLDHTTNTSAAPSSSQSSVEHLLAFGMYYSGRPDLQLGGTVYTALGQIPQVGSDGRLSGKPQDGGVKLVLRYLF